MNRTHLIPILSLAVLLVSGCSTDPRESESAAGSVIPVTRSLPLAEFDLNLLEYEEITGTLHPDQAGILGRELTTWGKSCYFGLNVPPGAISDPVEFTIRVPTRASYEQYAEEIGNQIIILLEPDGERFLQPLTVYATWMPWLGAPPANLIYSSDGTWGPAEVTYLPQIRRYRVTFQVDHFSDWRVRPAPPLLSE